MDFMETGLKDGDWMHLVQDSEQSRSLVNTVFLEVSSLSSFQLKFCMHIIPPMHTCPSMSSSY